MTRNVAPQRLEDYAAVVISLKANSQAPGVAMTSQMRAVADLAPWVASPGRSNCGKWFVTRSVSVDQSGAFAPLAAPLVCDDVVEVGDTESPGARYTCGL